MLTADNKQAMRPWVGEYQWPGKDKFLFGTVWLRADAPDHEVTAELAKKFQRNWMSILPDNVPLPNLINYRPGAIVFVPVEET